MKSVSALALGALLLAGSASAADFPLVGAAGRIVINPTTQSTIYVAFDSSASETDIYKSTDWGVTWIFLQSMPYLADFEIDPQTPSILYASAAVSATAVIFKSTDGGVTWNEADSGILSVSGTKYEVYLLAVDPVTEGVVYAADKISGLYKSIDGGQNWTSIDGGIDTLSSEDYDPRYLTVDPSYPSSVYFGIQAVPPIDGHIGPPVTVPTALYKSSDGGTTWAATGLTGAAAMGMAMDPANSSHLVACAGGTIESSTDGGATWVGGAACGISPATIAISSTNPDQILYAEEGSSTLLQSNDGGATFNPLHTFPQEITSLSYRSGSVYVGAYNSGLYISRDSGVTWTASSSALPPQTISVPMEEPSIQAAIDAASNGDTVLVAPGTYFEKLDFKGKAITVKSSGGAAATILDGQNSGPIVNFHTSEGIGSVIQGFTLTHGSANTYGSAIHVTGGASPSIEDNAFVDNADTNGLWGEAIGGDGSSPIILRNYFSGNTCSTLPYESVVGFVNSSSPVIADNIFVNNACPAVYLQSLASPQLYNNSMVGNRSGVVLSLYGSNAGLFVSNNLIAFNQYGLNATFSGGAILPPWSHNLVYGNTTADYQGVSNQTGIGGNISSDPILKDWAHGDEHLLYSSPAIDAGDSTVNQASASDFYGNTRVFIGRPGDSAVVDIGAAESVTPDGGAPASTVINVPADEPTIQAGIDAAFTDYTVFVAPGTYYEQIDFKGKAITVKSSGGAAVTILDGNNTGPIVNFHTGEGALSVLQGFTLTHARMEDVIGYGPAVNISGSSPTIEDNLFLDNYDGGGGAAAIYGLYASPVIIRNYFSGNSGADYVGNYFSVVAFVSGSSPVVADNAFVNNSIVAYYETIGGTDAPKVYNNTMVGNTVGVTLNMYANMSGTLFNNNLIAFNQTGVAVDFVNSVPLPPFSNNLVYGNTTTNYSSVADQTGTNSNISSDPKLKDWEDGDVHLLYDSPALDVGDSTVSQASATDFYGNARVFAGLPNDASIVDIGAAEYEAPIVSAAGGSIVVLLNTGTNGTLGSTGADPGEPLVFALVARPLHGAVTLTDLVTGAFTYVPAQGYLGTDSFTFHVVDPYGMVSSAAAEQLSVRPMPPIANNSSAQTKVDTAGTGMLSATPAYSDAKLTFSVASNPVHGTVAITSANGRFNYVPAPGYVGTDSFTFKVTDPYGSTATATESLTVTDIAPITHNANITVLGHKTYTGALPVASAYREQALRFRVVSAPRNGTVTITNANTGAYTYSANGGLQGTDSFTVQAVDQYGTASSVATVSAKIL
jgi:parallel beta-helix repeat protein